VKSICERAVLLDGGLLVRDGSPDQVFDYYNALVTSRTLRHGISQAIPPGRVRATAAPRWKR
jgi:lipopolysaccharide transport system ATP-binding protein